MMGKVLDMETRGDPTLSKFTMETYSAIAKYKNAYHTFKLPVSLALYMVSENWVSIEYILCIIIVW